MTKRWLRTIVVLLGASAPLATGVERQGDPVERVRVQVVDARTREPIPGAHLSTFSDSGPIAAEARLRNALRVNHLGGPWAKEEDTWIADDGGWVSLPRAKERRLLWSEHDGAWGTRDVPPSVSGPLILALASTPPLRVRLENAEGQPRAGLPVALEYDTDEVHGRAMTAISGEDGVAEFSLSGAIAQLYSERYWSVELAFPHRPLVSAVVDAIEKAEPLRLEVPPTGVLEVTVDGAFDADTYVRAAAHFVDADEWQRFVHPRSHSELVQAGRASFRVGLATKLAVSVWGGTSVLIDGPDRPGGTVTATLRVLPKIQIVGTAISSAGDPIADTDLRYRVDDRSVVGSTGMTGSTATTSAEGVFEIFLSKSKEPIAERTLSIWVGDEGGRIELPKKLVPGVHSVGEVPIQPLPILARGRVVDPQGLPVGGATVYLGSMFGATKVTKSQSSTGEFEVRGFPRFLDLSEQGLLAASKTDFYPSEPINIASGLVGPGLLELPPTRLRARTLRLRELRRVTGKLLLPEGTRPDHVHIRLVPGPFGCEMAEDGTFTVLYTGSGAKELEIYGKGLAEPLLRLPDVGNGGADPRLERIDLRRSTRLVTATVLDPNGEYMAYGNFKLTDATGLSERSDGSINFRRGRIKLLVGTEELGIRILGNPYRSIHVSPLETGMEIQLEPRGW